VSDEQDIVVDAEAVAYDDLGGAGTAFGDNGPLAGAGGGLDTPRPSAPVMALDPDLALVLDVPVDLVVEIGRTRMTIRETLGIGRGSIVTLDKLAGEPADLYVNGRLIARGEVVAIDEEFGFRVTDVVSPERRLEAGRS
jgi:flagellar motor switch protein FliN/FliY